MGSGSRGMAASLEKRKQGKRTSCHSLGQWDANALGIIPKVERQSNMAQRTCAIGRFPFLSPYGVELPRAYCHESCKKMLVQPFFDVHECAVASGTHMMFQGQP